MPRKCWQQGSLLDGKESFLYANSSMSGRPRSCIEKADHDFIWKEIADHKYDPVEFKFSKRKEPNHKIYSK